MFFCVKRAEVKQNMLSSILASSAVIPENLLFSTICLFFHPILKGKSSLFQGNRSCASVGRKNDLANHHV